jgi:hypothetical protein
MKQRDGAQNVEAVFRGARFVDQPGVALFGPKEQQQHRVPARFAARPGENHPCTDRRSHLTPGSQRFNDYIS